MKRIISILLVLSLVMLLFSCYNNGGTIENPPANDNTNNGGDDVTNLWADYIDGPNDDYMDGGTVTNYPFGKEIETELLDPTVNVEFRPHTFYSPWLNTITIYDIKIDNGVLWAERYRDAGGYEMIGELRLSENVNIDGDSYLFDFYDKEVRTSSNHVGQPAYLFSWEALYRIRNAKSAYVVDSDKFISGDPVKYPGKWLVYIFDDVYYILHLKYWDDGYWAVQYFGVGIDVEDVEDYYPQPIPLEEDIKTERFVADEVYSSVLYEYESNGNKWSSKICCNICISNGALYTSVADGDGAFNKWGNIALKEASPFVFNERLVEGFSRLSDFLETDRLYEVKDAFLEIRRCSTVYIATRTQDVANDPLPYDYLAIYLIDGECYIFGVSVDDSETLTYEKLYVGDVPES